MLNIQGSGVFWNAVWETLLQQKEASLDDHLGLSKSATATPGENVSSRQSNPHVGPRVRNSRFYLYASLSYRHYSTCFMNIISFHPHNKPRRQMPWSESFYKWGNQGTERSHRVPQVTQLGTGIQAECFGQCAINWEERPGNKKKKK